MRIITIGMDSEHVYANNMTACIGYFDGMHKGHQALVKKTIELAEKYHCETGMITFDPDPWVPIRGMKNVRHITTMRERINRAVELGIQNIVILRFTKEMSQLSPEDFVKKILGRLHLKALVCGFDFHYGYMGKGDAQSLERDAGIEVSVVAPVEDEEGKISSTRITKAIENGEMEKAHDMLGYFFTIEGTVIHGRHVGTGIGYPTANIEYSTEYIHPKGGVYAGFAWVDGKRYETMINYGHNPTFNYRNEMSLEANLFDFHDQIYGKCIRLQFVHFLRGETRFHSRDNLILQLEQDERNTRRILADYE